MTRGRDLWQAAGLTARVRADGGGRARPEARQADGVRGGRPSGPGPSGGSQQNGERLRQGRSWADVYQKPGDRGPPPALTGSSPPPTSALSRGPHRKRKWAVEGKGDTVRRRRASADARGGSKVRVWTEGRGLEEGGAEPSESQRTLYPRSRGIFSSAEEMRPPPGSKIRLYWEDCEQLPPPPSGVGREG